MLFTVSPLASLALSLLSIDIATALPTNSSGVLQRSVPADTIDKYTTEVRQSFSRIFGGVMRADTPSVVPRK